MTTDERKLTMLRIEWLISIKNAHIMEGNMMTQFRDGWLYDVMTAAARYDSEIEELFKTLATASEGNDEGTAWMRIERPEPYAKPKRYYVAEDYDAGRWAVRDINDPSWIVCETLPTRQAAERIAAIYEEVLP